jgi:hypothetical protein
MKLTKKEWKLILVSLSLGRIQAGSMAEERVSGFVDIPMQDRLEKPYKELIEKIKTKGLNENRH